MEETFEDFLQETCINEREFRGTPIIKDNFEDLYPEWIEDLDKQDLIDYADVYCNKKIEKLMNKIKQEQEEKEKTQERNGDNDTAHCPKCGDPVKGEDDGLCQNCV